MIKVDVEELVQLKEQGWSLRKIENYLKGIGKNVSYETIRKMLNKYYASIGKTEEKIEISDEELVELKEQGLSDNEIAQRLTKEGKVISTTSVGRRLRNYYELIGQEKPRKVSDEEIAALKEQGMKDVEIVEYLAQIGRKMSINGVSKKIRRHYKAIGKERPRVMTRTRKSKKEQLQPQASSAREDFVQQIKVKTPIEPINSEDKGSENVVNYSREDEER